LGQLPFGKLRKAGVKLIGDRAAEHAVTEELEALVVVRAGAAVRERALGEARIGEAVPQ
jgi:hypothetical protein